MNVSERFLHDPKQSLLDPARESIDGVGQVELSHDAASTTETLYIPLGR